MEKILNPLFTRTVAYIPNWAAWIAAGLIAAVIIERGENDGVKPVTWVILAFAFLMCFFSVVYNYRREKKAREARKVQDAILRQRQNPGV